MRNWHRRLGIASAILVVWLAVTGILVGHTDDLRLDEQHVSARWLLDWYGVHAPDVRAGYRVGNNWVIQVGERIYFNDRSLDGEHARVVGAVALSDEIVVATGEQLLMLTQAGVLVETLGPAHGVPRGLNRIGRQDHRLIVRSEVGNFAAEEDLLEWRCAKAVNQEWSEASAVPGALRERVVEDYRRRVLSLERVVLDVHSGRALGAAGTLLMDLAALAFLGLAGSGLWLWIRRGNGSAKSKEEAGE